MSSDRITVSRSKRGTTIKASGRAAQALFDAITSEANPPTAQTVAQVVIAWCWATGLIEIGPAMPDGAIEIARGPEADIRHAMEVAARHGYRDQLLVTGIPEARSESAKAAALVAWVKWHSVRSRPSVSWNPAVLAE